MISGQNEKSNENQDYFSLSGEEHSVPIASASDGILIPAESALESQAQGQAKTVRIIGATDKNTDEQSILMNKSSPQRRTTHEIDTMGIDHGSMSPPLNPEREPYASTVITPTSLTATPREKNNDQVLDDECPPPAPQATPLTLDDTHIEQVAISPLQPSILLTKSRDDGSRQIPPPVSLPFIDADENDQGSNDDFLLYAPNNAYINNHRNRDISHDFEMHDPIRAFGSLNMCLEDLSSTLCSLPIDALHSVATFLQIEEWRNFGLVNRDASLACREVLKKIKMHAFHCAVEVLTTWSRGEHADARELAALYVSCGVPIYPAPLGHAFHSIYWRMKVELEKMKKIDDELDNNENGGGRVDSFYNEMYEARNEGDYYFPSLSYVEEKGLFWKSQQFPPGKRRDAMRHFNIQQQLLSATNSFGLAGFRNGDENGGFIGVPIGMDDGEWVPIAENAALRDMDIRFSQFHERSSRAEDIACINAAQQQKRCHNEPKVDLYCHRHLVDRHWQGKAAVCDESGSMNAPPISLSADFFHPATSKSYPSKDPHQAASHDFSSDISREAVARPVSRRQRRQAPDELQCSAENHLVSPQSKQSPLFNKIVEHSMMAELELHSYDSKSGEFNCDDTRRRSSQILTATCTGFVPEKSFVIVTDIIQRYENMILSLLRQRDYSGVDDCMIDFWDEFFPTTETIHFFDRHTPVPRMSKLHTFLTRPCPKAFGTVQCEIERVRVRYRTKGMMTGRYYSTYEYRLFVTDRRLVDNSKPRSDTVMMTAKYRGKHYSGQSGLAAPMTSGKKGVNHYFLYMPQQSDIDEHFELVNENVELIDDHRYRQRVPALGSKMELSRLQTNYLGTEFQISSPFCDGDKNTNDMDHDDIEAPQSSPPERESPKVRKLTSLFSFKKSEMKKKKSTQKPTKISPFSYLHKRRVDDFGENSCQKAKDGSQQLCIKEREIGAITYTANVLGNRPRMMNVSIPTVNDETEMLIASDDTWIKSPGEEGRILTKLKAQQANHDQDNAVNSSESSLENADDLMSLRNRQPWWNVDLGAFVLNFGGRVSVASVKNFQLCDTNDHENNHESIMLQFGRIEGRHSFNMDFSYPLSPVQAFAISISSLQSKISFA